MLKIHDSFNPRKWENEKIGAKNEWIRMEQDPCPICGRLRCMISPDGVMCFCFRDGEVHRLKNESPEAPFTRQARTPTPPPKDSPRTPPAASSSWEPVSGAKERPVRRIEGHNLDTYARDNAYEFLLSFLPLKTNHYKALKARGMTDEEIRDLDPRTLPASFAERKKAFDRAREATMNLLVPYGQRDLKESRTYFADIPIPGFNQTERTIGPIPGDLMVFPVRDVWGRNVALRARLNDDDPRAKMAGKYRWLSGGNTPALPLGSRLHTVSPLLSGPQKDFRLWITEGEIKATLAAYRLGTYVVSLPGVSPPGHEQLKELLEIIRFRACREVVIAFDRDQVTNERVREGKSLLAWVLNSKGIQTWDATWDNAYKGLDDALVAGLDIEVAPLVPKQRPKISGLRQIMRYLPRGDEEEDRFAHKISACCTVYRYVHCKESGEPLGSPHACSCRHKDCPICRIAEAYMLQYVLGHAESKFRWPDTIITARWPGKFLRPPEVALSAVDWETVEATKMAMYKVTRGNDSIPPYGMAVLPDGFGIYLPPASGTIDTTVDKLTKIGFVEITQRTREDAISVWQQWAMALAQIQKQELLDTDVLSSESLERTRARWAYAPEMRCHKTIRRQKMALPNGLTDEQHQESCRLRNLEEGGGIKPDHPDHCSMHKDREEPCIPLYSLRDTVTHCILGNWDHKPKNQEYQEALKNYSALKPPVEEEKKPEPTADTSSAPPAVPVPATTGEEAPPAVG